MVSARSLLAILHGSVKISETKMALLSLKVLIRFKRRDKNNFMEIKLVYTIFNNIES